MTSTQTLNAALRGFTEADSDGIMQISVGGAEYLYGAGTGNAVTDHVLTRYDGVLRVDGGAADKAADDPPVLRAAEASMADRVVQACHDLGSAGRRSV